MSTIKYDTVSVFSGICETPLVSINFEPIYTNNRIENVHKITLAGRLKRQTTCTGFEELYNLSQTLINRLSKNFRPLEILDTNGAQIYFASSAIVQSVKFEENAYLNLVPFTIEFIVYNQGYASQGIKNPQEEVSFQENQDHSLTVTQAISATGFDNGTQAITNARTWVNSRGALGITAVPMKWSVIVKDFLLIGSKMSINRFDGTVTVRHTFLYSLATEGTGDPHLFYEVDVDRSQDDVTITIKGNAKGGIHESINEVRNRFNSVSWFAVADAEYRTFFPDIGVGDIENPTKFSVTENQKESSIDFQIEYSNRISNDPYLIDDTTISYDVDSGMECVTLKGEIVALQGCLGERWTRVLAYYRTFDALAFIRAKWAALGRFYKSTTNFKSKSVAYDEKNGKISFTHSICGDNSEECGCISNLTYSLKFSPAITQYSTDPTIDGMGCYYIQNLGFSSRGRFEFAGKCSISRCCSKTEAEAEIRSRANYLNNLYFSASNKVLEKDSVTFSENKTVMNFSFVWNGRQAATTFPTFPIIYSL